jgi:hypothetical protein
MVDMNEITDRQAGDPAPQNSTAATSSCVIAVILLVLLPTLGYGLVDHEWSRWQLASARVSWRDPASQLEAMELINRAIELDPSNSEALVLRAAWQTELGNYQQSCRDLKLAVSQSAASLFQIQLRQQLCEALYHEDELDAIVEQWELIDEASAQGQQRGNQPHLAEILYLNNRAYQLGLTGKKTEQSVADANRAIALMGGNGIAWDYNGGPLYLSACQSYLDGNEHEAALLCQQARRSAELFLETWEASFQPQLDWKQSELQQRALQREELVKYVARVIKLHSILLARMGRSGSSEAARDAVRQLGQDPDKLEAVMLLASQLHRLHSSYPELRATVLDTRGYSYLQNRQPNLALMDLEVAVKVYDAVHRQRLVQLNRQRNLAVEPWRIDMEMKRSGHQLAVMLFHRCQVYEVLHQPARARGDRNRIKRLGATADRHLF